MSSSNVTEMAENIYRIRLPMPYGLDHINVYLLKETNRLALVDCGLNLPESWQMLDAGLAELGLTPGQLTDIFVTHAHPDHIGQLPRLRLLAPEAHFYMHRREYNPLAERVTDQAGTARRTQRWLERNGLLNVPAATFMENNWGFLPQLHEGDRLLEGGEFFSFDRPAAQLPAPTGQTPDSWEILWTPGHTAGHFVLYQPQRRLLLSGDHLLGSISSNIGKYPGSTDDPLGDFINSLELISRLEVQEVLPAHGQAFTNHQERIKDLIGHHRKRLSKIYASLEHGPRTAIQVVETIWGDRATGFHRYLALVEALSHLERLRLEGRVTTEEAGPTVLYRAA
jgi:glyoxylase-like metal-dependent hydrolase (beta-lactamase superfamily II)